MNGFKQKKIRSGPPRKPLSEKTKQNIVTALGIILLALVLYYSGLQIMNKLSGTRVIEIISGIFGKKLLTDGKGHTNILLLGVGGEGHEGKDLTDTIILGSIDSKNKTVAMLSIPRDLYIESSLGGSRVNRLYEKGKLKWNDEEGMDFARKTIEDTLAVPIQYAAKIDFEGFEKIIDSVGGIDVYVEQTINDPFYPKENTYEYELFFLPQGNQHLDGKTALKYARSRKTSSDFDRSKRQHQILIALKSKALEENFSSRKRLIKQLYYSLQDHVKTNLSMREILSLAEFAAEWNSENLVTATLNDEPLFRGGFLYTPLRELYGGAFVLLPAGDSFENIRAFAELVLYNSKNLQEMPIVIVNGTAQNGLAAKTKSILNRFGFNIKNIDNAKSKNIEKTTWYGAPQTPEETNGAFEILQKLAPGGFSSQIPPEYGENADYADAKLILELGADSLETIKKLDIFRNVVSLAPSQGTSTPTQ